MRLPWHRSPDRAEREALVETLRRAQVTDEHGRPVGERKSAVRASLGGVDMSGADLRFADLREAKLRGADLSGAQFRGADLSWADLANANLEQAAFDSALLVEASLEGANLDGADLSRVTGLTWSTVRNATWTSSTKWPADFSPHRPDVAGPLIH